MSPPIQIFACFFSTDRGYSWTDPIPLDTSCYGYPGGYKLEDESIIISYVERSAGKSRIFVIRFKVNAARDGIELLPLGEKKLESQSG